MSNSIEALRKAKILFAAQVPIQVDFPTCKNCKGGKIHDIRKDDKIIVHCKGEACVTSAEKVSPINEKDKGSSID